MNYQVFKTSGVLQTNSYIFEKNEKTYVVDPGSGIGNYIDNSKEVYVLLTHGHFDHIMGLNEINVKKVYISPEDKEMLFHSKLNYSTIVGNPFEYYNIDKIKNIDEHFYTIKTPGHTLGSRVIIIEDLIFTGDTVFCETIGRSDLSGSKEKMIETIKKLNEIFKNMDESYKILPGHMSQCTLKTLFNKNPYFKRGNI